MDQRAFRGAVIAAAAKPDAIRGWIGTAVAVILVIAVTRQCRRPTWLLGRAFAEIMNRSHASLTIWGLSHIQIDRDATILDVGCGGGATVRRLASMAAEGRIFGVDYSAASVATARRTNAARIATGQVDLRIASVSALPFPDDTFDVVTAVETHYYWPDLHRDLVEILRVLKPGGTLIIIAEVYRGHHFAWLYRPVMALLGAAYLNEPEHRELFTAAGFTDVRASEQDAKGWICAYGNKVNAAGVTTSRSMPVAP
ncbi:MAG: class I SAM-dependent methyltransferase [Gemmatimonadaceae bacterium]